MAHLTYPCAVGWETRMAHLSVCAVGWEMRNCTSIRARSER
ncbi:hypothetical protein VULLAG_LOCUS4465 [Vulpes lagopus]